MKNNNVIIDKLRKMKFYLKGDIEELDNQIICYINETNIESFLENNKNGSLLSLKKINFNKPIYYIFYNINFLDCLTINSEGENNILFKNCTFNNPIYIKRVDQTIKFSNNKYLNINNYSNEVPYLKGNKINKIIFEHEFLDNLKEYSNKFNFIIDIDANEIKINNSCIDIGNLNDCYIKCNNFLITNSVLRINDLYLNADDVRYHNNYINATNIYINNKTNNINFNEILASYIILNDDILVDIDSELKQNTCNENDSKLLVKKI